FPVDARITIARARVIAQKAAATAALSLDRLEHVGEIARIVTSLGHDLRTKNVSLSFVLAAKLQQVDCKRRLGQLADAWATKNRSSDAGDAAEDAVLLSLTRLRRAVPQRNVADLVRHHASHLTFSTRRFDHSAVHVHWTTGKRECIDVSRVYDFEVVLKFWMLKLRWNARDEPASYILDIALRFRIAQQGKLALSFLRRLASEFNVVLNTVFVAVKLDLRRLRQRRERHHADRHER